MSALPIQTHFAPGVPAYVPQDQQGNAYVSGNLTVGGTVLDSPNLLVVPGTPISQAAVSGTFASPQNITTTNSFTTANGQAYDVDAAIDWTLASGTLGSTPDKLYFMWSASTANVSPFSAIATYQLQNAYIIPVGTVPPSNGLPLHLRGRIYMTGATAGLITSVQVATSSGTGSSAVWNFACYSLSLTRIT